MIAGGGLAAAGLVLATFHLPWYAQVGSFAVLGFGFYLLHGSIQVHVTELSQRRAARRPRCIRASSISGRRRGRWSTALASRMPVRGPASLQAPSWSC
ncbi:MAG: transporter, family, inner rane transport protein [Alphaproteobacteria bacterium]|nr:transporter, family, inner rane transport protein [Alphaproteobacteria bacterium]